MGILDTELNFIKPLKITIQGSWKQGTKSRLDWDGQAISTEPLVALTFLKLGNLIEWCKSSRGASDGIPLRVLNGQNTDDHSIRYLSFFAGTSGVQRTFQAPEDMPIPECLLGPNIITGKIYRAFVFKGLNDVELACMFLASSDAKMGRNHLWHIRKQYKEQLPIPFNDILTHGIKGKLRDA